jgi:hypothetical protein
MPTVSFKQQQFHKAMQSQFHAICQDGINTGCRTDRARGPNGQFARCLRSKESNYMNWSKGKAIPLQSWTGPGGSRRLRFPDFKTIGT